MKKYIIFFIEDNSYLFDNRMKRQASALIKAGFKLIVISPKTNHKKYFYNLDSVLSIHYPTFEANSIFAHFFERIINLSFALLFISCFILFKRNIKVVHFTNPTDIYVPSFYWIKLFGIKLIFDQHDLCPELYMSRRNAKKGLLYNILIKLEKISYKLSDLVIVTNESYKKVAISRGKIDANKIFIVRNGPILDRFKDVVNSKPNDDIIRIGYIGNINQPDGVYQLVDICSHIKEIDKKINFTFEIIGSGSDLNYMIEYSNKKNVSNHFNFYGRVSESKLINVMKNVHFCVQPDPFNPLNNVSTMNKLMEYMAMKKTFVSYDLVESRFSGLDSGLFSKVNEPKSYAKDIVRLCRNPNLRERLSNSGYKRIVDLLQWPKQAENLIIAYQSIINEK